MKAKQFNGKAIYNPSGKAGEYSCWACNFYVGCSNGCAYCYCKKGVLAGAMGGDVPTLKKCFKDEKHALEVFEKELKANLPELQKHGLFFSFTSDPMLPETRVLTMCAIGFCNKYNVPVKILTKIADWLDWAMNFTYTIDFGVMKYVIYGKDVFENTAFGFTLTGHDELEPNASTNTERIEAMRKLKEAGFRTWASIEPIIDFESSKDMIFMTAEYCSLYKIGLESGKKYDKKELQKFMVSCLLTTTENGKQPLFYFKDSLLKAAGLKRENLSFNCVSRDYNMFND